MIKEHTLVVLKKQISNQGLEPGAIGVVVYVHGQGEACEVEFMSLDGSTICVETVDTCDLILGERVTPVENNKELE